MLRWLKSTNRFCLAYALSPTLAKDYLSNAKIRFHADDSSAILLRLFVERPSKRTDLGVGQAGLLLLNRWRKGATRQRCYHRHRHYQGKYAFNFDVTRTGTSTTLIALIIIDLIGGTGSSPYPTRRSKADMVGPLLQTLIPRRRRP